MKTFKNFLKEGKSGFKKGTHEIVDTSIDKAIEYIKSVDENLYDTLSSTFENNYKKAQAAAKAGHTKRKNMPRIRMDNVREFQKRLQDGYIDINKPFGDITNIKNPFPEGLSGNKANNFLEGGLKKHDGSDTDDKVKVTKIKIKIKDLFPIQEQIYLSESLNILTKRGYKNAISFLSNESVFIVSSDNKIIDGHHRWLAAYLADQNLKVNCLVIDLPISKLLPMSLAYGDSIGNDRNK